MPRAPNRPHPLSGTVFRGSDALRRGVLTSDQLRSTAWQRIRHDVYADARLDRDHELACRAAQIRLPASTLFAGTSAAHLHGIRHAATFLDEVHVSSPPSVRLGAQRRLRVHHIDLSPGEVTVARDLPCTTPLRTAWDVAAWHEPLRSVPVIDSLLARGLTTSAALTDLLSHRIGRRGWRRAREAFALVDAGAQSPPESRLRVRLVLAGLPRPVAQCPVRVSPRLVLHPDLGWEQWRVAVEYDGRWHAGSLDHDRRRLNQLTAAGWTVLHVTHPRLQYDFSGILCEIRSALELRGWRPTRTPRK
ncbi:DUF559 domain-containing protein [Actinoplanes friuliensis]|uniref:DUF559 domain-containing protein n=1 Tax=Actinoplanes friuliensis DSM 7358 TaxID=1246995 RepID=U5WEK3_9ACTN|nr:DUF559 domain-containing protein [Actinoplanes friuliensis]AGZ46475.1 hypothetical protein AFR_41105 [Actinoplanes friuliensis DSM 7358]